MPSLYDILGVEKSASCSEIKKAFLKLARIHHPDKGGNPEKFKEILRASEVLTDENKRRTYDEMGIIPEEGGNGVPNMGTPFGGAMPFPFNMNDVFNMFTSGGGGGINIPGGFRMNGANPFQQTEQRKGKKAPPSIHKVNLTFEQFYCGDVINIKIQRQKFCNSCGHTGIKNKEGCGKCSGVGFLMETRQVGPITMHSQVPCNECSGQGYKVTEACEPCKGSGFINELTSQTINIKPGAKVGEVIVYPEACSDTFHYEKPGDAHIVLCEDPNDMAFKIWKRRGENMENMEIDVEISLAEALIGCVVNIDNHPNFEDGLYCRIPPGTFEGTRCCIESFGMPIFANETMTYGHLYLNVHVKIKPEEYNLFVTKGNEVLTPLFDTYIRKVDNSDTTVQNSIHVPK